jgi:hypothetical protein
MNYCISNGKGRIIGVRAARKRLVYGIFLVQVPGSVTIIMEANSPLSLDKHIGFFVLNEIITENAATATKLDFAGAFGKSSVPTGKSFGGKDVPYYRIYRNRLFWPAHVLK